MKTTMTNASIPLTGGTDAFNGVVPGLEKVTTKVKSSETILLGAGIILASIYIGYKLCHAIDTRRQIEALKARRDEK